MTGAYHIPPSLQQFQDFQICLVDDRCAERCQIDARSGLGVVTHPLTDDRNRYVQTPGYAGPRVTADIHGERLGELEPGSDNLQTLVHLVRGIEVLGALVYAVLRTDDGQQVGRAAGVILGYQLVHAPLPLDGELLPGLPPVVGENAPAEVGLAQVGHVDEGHATRIEREQEHVAGKVERGMRPEVHLLDLADDFGSDGPLHGFVHPRVDVPKGVTLGG